MLRITIFSHFRPLLIVENNRIVNFSIMIFKKIFLLLDIFEKCIIIIINKIFLIASTGTGLGFYIFYTESYLFAEKITEFFLTNHP